MKRDKSADELFRALKLLDRKMQKKVIKKGLKDGAKLIVAEIKARAPSETGNLERSVKIRASKRRVKTIGFSIVVGLEGTRYISHVEWGTRKMKANPFIRRASAAKKLEVVDKVGEAIEQELKASGWIN